MIEYVYRVTVRARDIYQADQVMAERISHDEDYGFEYTVEVTDVAGRRIGHGEGTP